MSGPCKGALEKEYRVEERGDHSLWGKKEVAVLLVHCSRLQSPS